MAVSAIPSSTAAINPVSAIRSAASATAYSSPATVAPAPNPPAAVNTSDDTATISMAGLHLQMRSLQQDLQRINSNGQLAAGLKQSQTALLNAQLEAIQSEIAQAQESIA